MKAAFEVPVAILDDPPALRAHVSNLAAARGWNVNPGAAISTRVIEEHPMVVEDGRPVRLAFAEVEVTGS